MTLLTEDQKKQIREYIQTFKKKVLLYVNLKARLIETEQELRMLREKLSDVSREEQQIEVAMEVLYGQAKNRSNAGELQTRITRDEGNSENLRNGINELKTDLLQLIRNLPIPADLERGEQEGSGIFFPYLEDAGLENPEIDTILDLFRQESPLTFNDVVILTDRVLVKNASDTKEAIRKLVEAIQSFRMRVDNLSESYERIDELIERLRRSTIYGRILQVFADKDRLSAKDIAEILNVGERTVYDSCYNLTRDNWSPSPIHKTSSGEWELTLAGEILLSRLREKNTSENQSEIR